MIFKSTIRQRKYDYLVKMGFYPNEATELSRTSRKGMSAPYFRRMVRSRKRSIENLKNTGKSESEIKTYIKNKYIANGWLRKDSLGRLRIDVWKLLRFHEEQSYDRGEEYESPWKKRGKTRSTTKKAYKRITRKDMLKSMIIKLERRIKRTPNINKQLELEEQLFSLQHQLRKMENEQ